MSVLETVIKPKVFFDANDKKHLTAYKKFLSEGTCGHDGCRFVLKFPYLTIPDMIKDELIHKMMGVKRKDWWRK